MEHKSASALEELEEHGISKGLVSRTLMTDLDADYILGMDASNA